MNIKYPVKYDVVNLSVNDADGRVLALVGWPRCTKPLPEIHEIGKFIAESMNSYETTMRMIDSNEADSVNPEVEGIIKRGRGRPRKVA